MMLMWTWVENVGIFITDDQDGQDRTGNDQRSSYILKVWRRGVNTGMVGHVDTWTQ